MTEKLHSINIKLMEQKEALGLFGANDVFLKLIEDLLEVTITTRGEDVSVSGKTKDVQLLEEVLITLLEVIRDGISITERDIIYAIDLARSGELKKFTTLFRGEIMKNQKGKSIRSKTLGQMRYITAINTDDLVFGIGPAGTGKTYLAVVMAVNQLKQGLVKKIILTRPAVEAGESLGFLPGDLKEKVDPYLRPLYDALHDVLGVEQTMRLIERQTIEIAPLAYMRGRTLDDASVILDEAQNTTPEQMKMFLTRLGFGSKMVVTGDITQIDLPKGIDSGLKVSENLLSSVKGASFIYLDHTDVVRHPLVQRIIQAYDED